MGVSLLGGAFCRHKKTGSEAGFSVVASAFGSAGNDVYGARGRLELLYACCAIIEIFSLRLNIYAQIYALFILLP